MLCGLERRLARDKGEFLATGIRPYKVLSKSRQSLIGFDSTLRVAFPSLGNRTCEYRMKDIRIAEPQVGLTTNRGALPGRRLMSATALLGTIAVAVALSIPATGWPVPAQSVSPGVRLQAGIEKEEVEGDLKSAMDIYQTIAADASASREVRSKALLRLAGCDEKLGHQANQIYQQIVHDFADQPAAALARKRLLLLQQQEHPAVPATMGVRKIETSTLGSMAETDTDGERAVYSTSSKLYLGDLGGHSRRFIAKFEHAGWIPSRDFSMVALNLLATPDRLHTVAVIKTDGTGYRELIRDDRENSIFGENRSFAMSWSWDDRNLALSDFSFHTEITGQIWIVSVADGRRRLLAEAKDGWIRKTVFSPDGRFLAYERWARDTLAGGQTSQIFVAPVQGGVPRMVYESAPWQAGNGFICLMDWTVDGQSIALKDIRNGNSALYLLPMKDGGANGPTTFVRFGEFNEGYTTLSGALIYSERWATPGRGFAAVTSIDSEGHLQDWRSLDLNAHDDFWPSFSPDGNQIAYAAVDADPAHRNLVVRDLLTARERVIYRSNYPSLVCQYSFHNAKVFCSVETESRSTDFFSVSVESGEIEHIATFAQPRFLYSAGQDDESFYFSEKGSNFQPPFEPPIIQWKRSTLQETVIIPARHDPGFEVLSPDARWVLRLRGEVLSVRPVSDGEWRTLVSGARPVTPPHASPDGRWALYDVADANGKFSLFRVPIAGGEPQRMGDIPFPEVNLLQYCFFSADGKRMLATQMDSLPTDLWILRNFIPSPQK
jgi:Tol biopolymer transport system component